MVYLDNAATTPVLPEVLDAMLPYLCDGYGNPSSLHSAGRFAKDAVEKARQQVADAIGADSNQIVFTSGGSESNTLALCGLAAARQELGDCRNHIITSSIEHHSVLETCGNLSRRGYRVTELPVTREGNVLVDDVRKNIDGNTLAVSIMMANNEIGTIEPIQEITDCVHGVSRDIFVHSDATQAVGSIPIDVHSMGIDMMSFSGHKIYAPKGIGILYIADANAIKSRIYGGSQEMNLRAGTENVPGIIGLGAAMEIMSRDVAKRAQRIEAMRHDIEHFILHTIPGSRINGDSSNKLPGIISVTFEGIDAQSLLFMLDSKGICVSAGSACASNSLSPSHVLTAIGLSEAEAYGTIRISLGRHTDTDDVNVLKSVLSRAVDILRFT